MNPLLREVDAMARQPGILACALVDASAGLVWHASGAFEGGDSVWEAAVEYWRLYERQKLHFDRLGELRAAVMYHTSGMLAVLPCCKEPDLLLIALGEHRRVDWLLWQQRVSSLGGSIGAALAPTPRQPHAPA